MRKFLALALVSALVLTAPGVALAIEHSASATATPESVYPTVSVIPTESVEPTESVAPTESVEPTVPAESGMPWLGFERIAGATRYETAVAISRSAFTTSTVVLVASGENFPDALCAGPLAAAYGAPLLLTQPDKVPPVVTEEIARLEASEIIVIGGEGAVTPGVFATLGATRRIAGIDRYATSGAIADELRAVAGTSTAAFVVTGQNFPDALSVGAPAAARNMPILLTRKTALPDSIDFAAYERFFVAGGSGVIATSTISRLGSLAYVTRFGGVDRYDTCARVVEYAVSFWGADLEEVGISSGAAYPDALTAGPVLGASSRLQLLTAPGALTEQVGSFLRWNEDMVGFVSFFGGAGALSEKTVSDVRVILEPGYVPPVVPPVVPPGPPDPVGMQVITGYEDALAVYLRDYWIFNPDVKTDPVLTAQCVAHAKRMAVAGTLFHSDYAPESVAMFGDGLVPLTGGGLGVAAALHGHNPQLGDCDRVGLGLVLYKGTLYAVAQGAM